MNDARTRMTVEVKLACGCWVCRQLETAAGVDLIEKTLTLARDALPHWFDRAELTHKCSMVTDDNPDGVPRTT